MKYFFTFLFALLMSVTVFAQNISVASFEMLPNDLTANTQGTTVYDQNGEKCALIKVETTQTGFTFDAGSLGVVKTEQHTAEVWVYVPAGVKRLSIAHQQLGRLNEYDLGMSLQKAKTYRLTLTTGTVTTVVTEAKKKTGWIIIDSTPAGASVYLNDDYVGNTPLDTYKAPYGQYVYRLELGNYHNANGMIDLNQPSVEVKVPLKPAFGSIRVESSVSGAQVLLDGKSIGKTTPCTIEEVPSGSHHITVQIAKYAPRQLDVVVNDGETASVNASLDARFAQVSINTLAGAQISIDGRFVGNTNYNEELMEGYYDVEVSLAHHKPATKQVQVIAGQPQTLQLDPTPIYGSLDVMSSPRGATVTIDGKDYGKTPTTIEELLEGPHSVVYTLAGYASETRQVSITENQTASVNATLQNGKEVTIKTDKTGDQIYVDGTLVGISPYTCSLTFGSHTAYAMRDGKKSQTKDVNVPHTGSLSDVMLGFIPDGRTFTVKKVSFRMIAVKGGTFQMGATSEQQSAGKEEKPVHSVTLSDYSIGETEVTQELWQAVMGKNPSNFKGPNNPVEQVSWEDCQTFIQKLNKLTKQNFRLPTEAEWEYAARGGNRSSHTQYSGSSSIDAVAWYDGNSGSKTHPVKTRQPNELGIYDMSGNVWEWCHDWYGSYSSGSQTNPKGATSGSIRVIRGGGWDSGAGRCRVAYRDWAAPGNRCDLLGLRLAL